MTRSFQPLATLRFSLAAVLVGWCGSLAAAQLSVVVSSDAKTVTVGGVTPGAEVYVGEEYLDSVNGAAIYGHADRFVKNSGQTGSVTLTFSSPVPDRSLWIALDLSSGGAGVGGGAQTTPDIHSIPLSAMKKKLDSGNDEIEVAIASADILLFRQGVGIWRVRIDPGGGNQDVADDGQPLISFDSLVAIRGGGNAPPKLLSTDTIAIIDPLTLKLYTNRGSN